MGKRANEVAAISLLILMTGGAGSADTEAGTVLDIGSRRELFVDQHLIDRMDGVRLELNRPRNEGTVIEFDQPWEYPFAGCPTIIRDGEKFILIYRGMRGTGDGTDVESTCYAESPDGINWTKPNLGLFEVTGTIENNVILAHDPPLSHNFAPFLDTRPGAGPERKFKAVAGTTGSGGLVAFASPDAIHWTKLQDQPVITEGAFDSHNVAFWSEAEGQYLCYFRTFKNGFRWVSRTTSDDFINWSPPVEMEFHHGDGLAPAEHIYTNGTHPYFRAPHIYIAMPFRFVPGRKALTQRQIREIGVHPSYAGDCSDGILMTSRGGAIYDRTFLESFLRPDMGAENWVSRTNMPAYNVVQTSPTEMSLYLECNYAQPTVNLRRYTLRLDGFASIHADYGGGEMLTKPFVFAGERLFINFATSAPGGIRVEIQDESGAPIPGFALADSVEQVGNEIEREVSWEGGADVSALAGRPARLRFVMKDADLYALRFGPAPPAPPVAKLKEGLHTFDSDSPAADGIPTVSDLGDAVRSENSVAVVTDGAAVGTGAVRFAGTGGLRDRLEFVDTYSLGSEFTIAAFVSFQDLRWTRLFSNYSGGGPAGVGELALSYDPTGTAAPGIVLTIKGDQVRTGEVELQPNRYHHFAATYSDGDCRVYLDGNEAARGTVEPGPIELTWDLGFGEDLGGGPNEQLHGLADDILILGRALAAPEIDALSRRGG
ncbi:MAG TPA: LamG-like jellyroll fold domain-containing protein [Armatimonadota bacterium]|nr:LamG-like jellyroll fold domain-containing protein [Armatimonadota bacterium]